MSVRFCSTGLFESADEVPLVVDVPDEAVESSEPVRRRIVGLPESFAETSALFVSAGCVPPLAITCGSGPLFAVATTVSCGFGLNGP